MSEPHRSSPGQVPGDRRQARQLTRRQAMTELVVAEGSMRIEALSERFGISLMTAHRDLDELVARGLLRKSRGVASAAPTRLIEASEVYRRSRQAAQKSAIARLAAEQVEPGQALFLDDSTTVLRMVDHLRERTPLTLITHSVTLMNAALALDDITLLGLGGQHQGWCNAFMGSATVRQASRLRADTLVMSMAAISDDVVFHPSEATIDVKRAMFDASARRILLADHTKFERRALHGFLPLDAFDQVIVDEGIAADDLSRLHELDIDVLVAPTEPS